ncbi:ABC transporter substrate-binding protein [Longimycelium tulufanense]|uniref:ABC transporter substrate-binding protein n=1 Tax=Longimycelium tulufanense TaxID=907463 RepID=A0A8J3C8G6_9PSEU|nr:ABC transporter permease [Longimycelium tulufanense]GGM33160.1 ABC transporter substrate-binding protein [Longimycelium tulufanense]
MLRATLAGLKARTARLLLSSVAIALGVAFVTGTLVLGDAMTASLQEQFTKADRNIDVSITPARNGDSGAKPLTDEQLAAVRKVPGVSGAEPRLTVAVPIIGSDGKARMATGIAASSEHKLLPVDLKEGRFPERDSEVTVDQRTARVNDLKIGQQVEVLGKKDDQRKKFTVVGTYDRGIAMNQSFLYDQLMFMPNVLQSLIPDDAGGSGYSEIVAAAQSGVSQDQLAGEIRDALGSGVQVKTGQQAVADTMERVEKQSGGFTMFMLTFAVIALVVAAMVIYNTFTILIAQRTRELALLRCVGADRGQLFRSVLVEAVAMGLFASALGFVGGLGLSAGLQALLNAAGEGGGRVLLPVTPTTVLAALGVGVLVTVAAAVLPARRATTVAPIAALRSQPDSHDEVARTGKLRIATVVLLALAGAGALLLGGRVGQQAGVVIAGVGTMFLLAAVVALGPIIVGPLNRMLGALPGAVLGVPARLASANAGRNPKRTAATTAALMIGVTIVTLVTVVAASGKQSANDSVDRQMPADFQVSSMMYDRPLPADLPGKLAGAAGVDKAVPAATVYGQVGGKGSDFEQIDGVRGDGFGSVVRPKVTQGDLGKLGAGTVALDENKAQALNAKVGDTVPLKAEEGQPQQFRVVAIYSGKELPAAMVDLGSIQRIKPDAKAFDRVLVKLRQGVGAADGKAAVDKALSGLPTAQVVTAAEVKEQINKGVDSMLQFVWALIGMAVVIALFGIANTLSLSVLERTRESALLRALGFTRGQLRLMLLVESVLMALMGAVIGVALGTGFAWALLSMISGEEIAISLVMPFGQIGAMLLAALVAAIIAAVAPARRAARTSVVSAMATE